MELDELRLDCQNCRACHLCDTRTNVVFGVGVPEAEVMFIGEGPGENEDLQGEPFVGRAGQLLDDMLKIIDLDRHTNIYIANMVKCRPPKNRDPSNEEQAACWHWLETQMELISPKLVICLGRIAAKWLIDPNFKITQDHGKWFDLDGIRYTAIYHPPPCCGTRASVPRRLRT
jgi:DNA polymerase